MLLLYYNLNLYTVYFSFIVYCEEIVTWDMRIMIKFTCRKNMHCSSLKRNKMGIIKKRDKSNK